MPVRKVIAGKDGVYFIAFTCTNGCHYLKSAMLTMRFINGLMVALPAQYAYSAAKFYLTGEHTIHPVTNYIELRDIGLTKSHK